MGVQVEMAKVKIDVIKPWIATRVTELLGFEDEVLINFIYGLLDVKVLIPPLLKQKLASRVFVHSHRLIRAASVWQEADGKHLQIQLTGFMEKNTGRFMKELWGLLTSAQNNQSGVPQQFLDAKAEEAKKKKVRRFSFPSIRLRLARVRMFRFRNIVIEQMLVWLQEEKDRILSEVLRKKEEQEKDAEEERQRRQVSLVILYRVTFTCSFAVV